MTTVIIDSAGVQATSFVEYARTLPFATVVEEKKKSFEEASAECNAVSVDEFFDELNSRIEKWTDHA
jgi:predicted HTH domain antitoxin